MNNQKFSRTVENRSCELIYKQFTEKGLAMKKEKKMKVID